MARAAVRHAPAAGHAPVRLALHAMACRFELVLAGGDAVRLRAVGEEALDEVRRCEGSWSLFRRDSTVARINREAAGRSVRVDPDTFALLQSCVEVHAASGGAFDPTVAAWMAARGLHRGSQLGARAHPSATGMDGVLLDPAECTVRFTREGLALDLGAVGKGAALDLAARVLREHGVSRALLHGGTSTVIALGAPPGTEGWRVRIGTSPTAPAALVCDGALSVSAPHGRGVRGTVGEVGHVLDPRTGACAPRGTLAAVLGESATLADAWSTALLVGGEALLSACPGAALLGDAPERRITGGGRAPVGCAFSGLSPTSPTP